MANYTKSKNKRIAANKKILKQFLAVCRREADKRHLRGAQRTEEIRWCMYGRINKFLFRNTIYES